MTGPFRRLRFAIRHPGIGIKHLLPGKRSYTLHQLDRKLEPFMDFDRGLFIEAGANDGVNQSNTLYFEQYRGWRGLLVEAVPDLALKCRQNRPDCITEPCALVASGYPDETIEITYCDLMSCVQGAFGDESTAAGHVSAGRQYLGRHETPYRIRVPARTLSAVLDAHGIDHVDLLSLDVEGYEAEALRGIDFDRHAPSLILVEVRPDQKEAIGQVLGKRYGVRAVLSSQADYEDVLYALR
jgi:FkbM family methyltransferase